MLGQGAPQGYVGEALHITQERNMTMKKYNFPLWITYTILIVVIFVVLFAVTGCIEPAEKAKETEEVTLVNGSETPQACIDAMDTAEKAFQVSREYIESTLIFPDMVSEALLAGATMDIAATERISTQLEDFSAEVYAQADELTAVMADWEIQSAECRGE